MAKRRPAGRRQRRAAGGSQWLYVTGAAVALGLVAAVIMVGTASRDDSDGADDPIVVPTSRPSAVDTNGMIYGNPDASVTVVEYLDFQCPVCLRANQNVLHEIEQKYVETGQAKLEVKPIAILGDESVAATEGAQCASAQGRFWPYHDILFANQGAENDGGFSDSRLKEMATKVGLIASTFNNCLDSDTYESRVKADTDAANDQGVRGTPTIFVDGTRVETSVDAISSAIEAALSGG
ncbi:MAG TPA: thioredoxin domain-containing protein [Dehalococcoidia bacterium]|nr:thioredoxin domain-containing protein [Dehalococcoidia bacterium]